MNNPRCDKCDGLLHEDCVVSHNNKKFCSLKCKGEYQFLRNATETELEEVSSFQLAMLTRRLRVFNKGA